MACSLTDPTFLSTDPDPDIILLKNVKSNNKYDKLNKIEKVPMKFKIFIFQRVLLNFEVLKGKRKKLGVVFYDSPTT